MRAETGRPDAQRGFTLIELVVAAGILAVLAMGIIPVAKVASVRADEIELRRSLRTVRMAIDAYREAAEAGEIDPDFIEPDHENYPPDLEALVEGVPGPRSPDGRVPVLRFLRRLPADPMTGRADWLRRSHQDDPERLSWGGQNVYDIRSASPRLALDGTPYRSW
ncbi:MAG: type II secretion system protein [Acidobacteria bacterium]|nr:type II secretion system protein [Acidobacteriota bacterium]